MARPLQKTYNPRHPYVVERHDQEDGSITYEVWDLRPDSYRRLCSINEHYDSLEYSDEDKRPSHSAKDDAELIARALNILNGGPL